MASAQTGTRLTWKQMSGCLGTAVRCAVWMCRFEFWGFYITRIRKRAVVNHSILVAMCDLSSHRSLPSAWVGCYGVNWSPHLWNMCGVNITIDNVRDKKVKVSIVGPHSELTQPSGPANACPGSTPGHWGGFYWGWDQYHSVIIGNEGWAQSRADWTGDVGPGKLIPHQLSAAILFHWQEE